MHKRGSNLSSTNSVVLFDGHCNLCNTAVQFIIKRDRRAYFKFASLDWPFAAQLMEEQKELMQVDSILLLEKGELFTKSTAALKIAGRLDGLWPLMKIFFIVPTFIRDRIYNWVAQNRYKWFGRRTSCMVPDDDIQNRFLQ